jgi:hypothetical protein
MQKRGDEALRSLHVFELKRGNGDRLGRTTALPLTRGRRNRPNLRFPATSASSLSLYDWVVWALVEVEECRGLGVLRGLGVEGRVRG